MAGGLGGLGDFVTRALQKAAKEGRIGEKVTDAGRSTRSARAPGTEGKGRKKKPVEKVVRELDWDTAPAEQIHEMLQTAAGQEAISKMPASKRGDIRRRLHDQNRLWGDQFDAFMNKKRQQPSKDFDPKKDMADAKPKAAEEKPRRTSGEQDYDDKGRSKEAVARKLTREAEGNEAADVASTTRAVEGVSEGRARAQRPLTREDTVAREQRPRGRRATPLEINPPLQRSSVAGATRGSDVIAGGGDGSVALPVAKKVDEGIGVPDEPVVEISPNDAEIDPNGAGPERVAAKMSVGKGGSRRTAKPVERETRPRDYRVSGEGKKTRVAGPRQSSGKDGRKPAQPNEWQLKNSESAAEYQRRSAVDAAGFYPNSADSALRLTPQEMADAKINHGTDYDPSGGRPSELSTDRFGAAVEKIRSLFRRMGTPRYRAALKAATTPEEVASVKKAFKMENAHAGDEFLASIANAQSPEHAYHIAYQLGERVVDNDMPGVRTSASARNDAVHGVAEALVSGYGWSRPNTLPKYVQRANDAARQADIASGHIQPPTKAPAEPGPEPSLKDFLRRRALERADRNLAVRPSAKVREPQPNEFPLRPVEEKPAAAPEQRVARESAVDEASLSEFEKQLNAIINRGGRGGGTAPKPKQEPTPAPATDPDDLADEIPDPFNGSEDAMPAKVDARATRAFRDILPIPPRGKKATAPAPAAASDVDEVIKAPEGDGLDPVPVGGVEAKPTGRQRRGESSGGVKPPRSEMAAAAKRDDGTTQASRQQAVREGWSADERAARSTDRDVGMSQFADELRGTDNTGPTDAELREIDSGVLGEVPPRGGSPAADAPGDGELAPVPSEDEVMAAMRREREAARSVTGRPRAGGEPAQPRTESSFNALEGTGGRQSAPGAAENMDAIARERALASRDQQASTRQRRAPASVAEPPPAAGAPPAAPPPKQPDAGGRRGSATRPTAPPPAQPPAQVFEYENVILRPGESNWAFETRGPQQPSMPQTQTHVPAARTSQYVPGGSAAEQPGYIPPWQRGPQPNGVAPPQVSAYDANAGASSTLIDPSQIGASSTFIPQSQIGASSTLIDPSQIGASSAYINPAHIGANTNIVNQGAHSTFIHPMDVGAHTPLRTILPAPPGTHSPLPLPSSAFTESRLDRLHNATLPYRNHVWNNARVYGPAAGIAAGTAALIYANRDVPLPLPDGMSDADGQSAANGQPVANGLVPAAAAAANTIRSIREERLREGRERLMRQSRIGLPGTTLYD